MIGRTLPAAVVVLAGLGHVLLGQIRIGLGGGEIGAGRTFRLFAAAATILIQLLIIATSNHNFINLLTIALCLFLLDDQALRSFVAGLSASGLGGIEVTI